MKFPSLQTLLAAACAFVLRPASAQTITYADAQPAYNNPTTIASGAILTLNLPAGSAQENGALSGAGGIEKIGDGVLTLNGSNNYSGLTTITAGTLRLGANTAIPLGRTVNIAAGATFQLSGNGTARIGTLTGSGTVSGGGTLQVGAQGASTFFGTVSNTGFYRDVLGGATGDVTLAGTTVGMCQFTPASVA